ncbi:MAG: transcription antitermination factor NusB [Actinomycetes bacterium]
MAARTKARRRAIDIAYEAEARGVSMLDVLQRRIAEGAEPGRTEPNPYTGELVEGVAAHRERIDELLATYAEGWALDRMPAVDRAILRVATYELLWGGDDVPDAVVLDEAVSAAQELSTDASPKFVNGLLSRLQSLKPSLVL